MPDKNRKKTNLGFSLIEMLIVLVIAGILSAIAIPQMVSQRRLLRSSGIAREIMTQMRLARQMAMAERQSVTFEYNDVTKQIRIINHHNNHRVDDPVFPACVKDRKQILVAAGYPMTACARQVSIQALAQGGLPISEITYGIPTAAQLPPSAPVPPVGLVLGDGISMTALTVQSAGADGKVFITFQNDGSVINNLGLPRDTAMFLFNNFSKNVAQTTPSAISVVGASGRVKVWRYQINGNTYIE